MNDVRNGRALYRATTGRIRAERNGYQAIARRFYELAMRITVDNIQSGVPVLALRTVVGTAHHDLGAMYEIEIS